MSKDESKGQEAGWNLLKAKCKLYGITMGSTSIPLVLMAFFSLFQNGSADHHSHCPLQPVQSGKVATHISNMWKYSNIDINMSSGKSPPSNGLKVQDCWFLGCTFFILAAILEYGVSAAGWPTDLITDFILFQACLFIKRRAMRVKKKNAGKSKSKSCGISSKLCS